jgi:hypothetical protein
MIRHRPGDPRREPLLSERPRDPWADDREPGTGLARALVATLGGIVFAVAFWSLKA